MKRIAFNTLGCRLNQFETDSLVTQFKNAGYQVVDWQEAADAYVINTCTVTDRSDRKSRALIGQARRASDRNILNGDPIVVVTGCYADYERNNLEANDGITYVVDNDHKAGIFAVVDSHFKGESAQPAVADRFAYGDSTKGFHTRSTIKIQDGCDNFCTFCIIPHVRGKAVSRPADEIVLHAEQMIRAGAKEVVVTGVNIGRYEWEDETFTGLIARLLNLEGDYRLRISSIEPDSWSDEFIGLLDHPKLCPHLHLCLQSGSERILLAMRRQYTAAGYIAFVEKVRRRIPGYNITTDIMVGFPGETEEEFQETCDLARKVGFSHIHTFPYSVREGTRAARMDNLVPAGVKAARGKIIRELSDAGKRAYRETMTGSTQRMLVERVEKGVARGYGEHYVPIHVDAGADASADASAHASARLVPNTFVDVRLATLAEGDDPVFHGVEVSSHDTNQN